MSYKYTHFIPENTALAGAKRIGVYDSNGKRVCGIPLGKLALPDIGAKLYSFGLVSDMHINVTDGGVNSTRLDKALTYFEHQGASFCCHAGDITTIGFWYPPADAGANIDATVIYPYQFEEFKRICDMHPNLPVYGCCGNHESYTKSIEENLTELEYYTGHGLRFTVTHGNDVFIFVGQSVGPRTMSDESLQWLYETLEDNRNKRCFVFIHPYVSAEDSGNPLGLHTQPVFEWWGATKAKAFASLMSHYKNTMLFHGHSHIRPDVQTMVKNVNYSTTLGFRSFSLPSSSNSRNVTDGALINDGSAYCYMAEVYENCVVMRAYDLLESADVPIAQYCIDTTLRTVEAGKFTDSTGTIIP